MAQENNIVNGNQIFIALNSITRDSMEKKKKGKIDFRFLDKQDVTTPDEKKIAFDELKRIERELEEKYGISVEFYENIDIKNTSEGHKFYFRIYDDNNCFTEIDALEYRKIVLDPSKSEIDYIAEKLFVIIGLKVQGKAIEISEKITELISYVYYYDELQFKLYENIGWDIYNKELIFKYDRIYKKNDEEILSACISDIAGKLTKEYDEDDKANWRDKLAKLMNSSTVARIVISAACTGLVRSIIPYNKENNINMNIIGEPGSGKSSLSQFALSIFADPHAVEGSFIDKDNAMEVIRVKRPIIPYVLDDRLLKIDTLSEKAKGREMLFDIFREYEGKVTERIGGTYKEMSGKRTNAPIISSSVESMMDVLLSSGKDLGQYRRFIELELKREDIFEGKSRVVDEYHNLSYQYYGIGVKYIANYIMNTGIKFINDLYECVLDDITDKLEKKSEEVGIRGLASSASRFALIATTYIIIRETINEVNAQEDECKQIYNIEDIGYDAELKSKSDMFNSKDDVGKYNILFEMESLLKNDSKELITDYIAPKVDAGYDELVEYLINNLVEKMSKVFFEIDIYKNLVDFLKNPLNDKWFISTSEADFFKKENMKTYIGYKKQKEKVIEITFRNNKYIEWLMCSGVKLEDDDILSLLEDVDKNQNDKGCETIAKKLFGTQITAINFEESIKKYPLLDSRKKDRINSIRNIFTLIITLPELEVQENETK